MRFTLYLCTLLMAAVATTSTVRADSGTSSRIRVFVTMEAPASGFVDTTARQRDDAVRDLRESILKKRREWLELVDRAADADISIEVSGRFLENSGASQSTSFGSGSVNKKGDQVYNSGSTMTRAVQNYVLKADLIAGEYREPLTGIVPDTYLLGGPWRTAANQITQTVETFARNNLARLLSQRAH